MLVSDNKRRRTSMAPTTLPPSESALATLVRDAVARAIAVVGLAGVALIHLLDSPGTFDEQAYKGWLYLGLIAGSIATAAALIRSSDSRAWLAAGLLPVGALVGFVVSRTVGLPGGADDIGNWTEPLGLASLFVEGCLLALAGAVLSARLRTASEAGSQETHRIGWDDREICTSS
jgi:hypothetical protein